MGKTTAAYTAKRITRGVVIFAFVMTLLASCLSVEAPAVDSPPPEEAYDPSGA